MKRDERRRGEGLKEEAECRILLMDVPFEVGRRVEDLASEAFAEAKRLKKKLKGVEEALDRLHRLEEKPREKQAERVEKKAYWFMRYRWLLGEDYLLIGGRSAEQNEELIKRVLRRDDLVFHAELPGSPFVILRGGTHEESMHAAARLTAIGSRAWREGLASIRVFHVKPEQVSKHARAGEYMGKGSFMIYGEKTFHDGEVSMGLTIILIKSAPYVMPTFRREEAFAWLTPGRVEQGVLARRIRDWLREKNILLVTDEILQALPPGPADIIFLDRLVKRDRSVKHALS